MNATINGQYPECHSLRSLVDRRHACVHPHVHTADQVVSPALCRHCDLRERPAPPFFRALPSLAPRSSPATTVTRHVQNWSVGVTTAPRREPTLARCLASLRAAGWEQPHVFAEPGVDVPAGFEHVSVTRRQRTLGAFPNWYLALTEMFLIEPQAEGYLLCQDDVLLSEGLREYLERNLWPAPEVGVVSVYCPAHYAVGEEVGFCLEDHGAATWGALAYLFSNPSIRQFLSDALPIDHRHHGVGHGLQQVDGVVGCWCRTTGLPYYVHNPSLAQHIGDTSTIGGPSNLGRRRADRFLADVRDLIPESPPSPNGAEDPTEPD